MELLNPYVVNETFHIYVNKGEEAPTSYVHAYSEKDLWIGAKGIYIPAKESCYNCNYTISIEVAKGSYVKLSSYKYGKIREFSLFETIYDMMT
jgi:hypothetical protein